MAKTVTIERLIKMIQSLANELKPTTEFLKAQATIAMNNRREDMENGIDINGKAFTALKQKTIDRKEKTGSKTPNIPLVNRGYLKAAKINANSKRAWLSPNSKRTDPDITTFHNEGLGNNPKREHWGFSKKTVKAIRENWDKWTRAKIHKVFG